MDEALNLDRLAAGGGEAWREALALHCRAMTNLIGPRDAGLFLEYLAEEDPYGVVDRLLRISAVLVSDVDPWEAVYGPGDQETATMARALRLLGAFRADPSILLPTKAQEQRPPMLTLWDGFVLLELSEPDREVYRTPAAELESAFRARLSGPSHLTTAAR